MAVLTREVELQPKQLSTHNLLEYSDTQYEGYGGAKKGGKTHLVRASQYLRRMKYPGTTGCIIRQSFPELEENHIIPFLREYPECRPWYREKNHTVTFPSVQGLPPSRLVFRYFENENHLSKFQGIGYDDISLDEATQHTEGSFKILKTSLLQDPVVRDNLSKLGLVYKPKFLLTFNPGGVGHGWVKRLFVDRKFIEFEEPDDYNFTQALIWDNPRGLNANPQFLRNLLDLPYDQQQAYLYGNWDIFSGKYFSGYKIINTVPIAKLGNVNLFAGCDWGKRDPASSHVVAVDSEGMHTICMPIYGSGMIPYEFGNAMLLRNNGLGKPLISTTADASMWDQNQYGREIRANGETVGYEQGTVHSIANQVESAGLTLARVGSRNRVLRYTHLQSLMCQGKYQVMDCCKDHIRELNYAVYNTKNTGQKEDIDSGCSNHSLDDVGYCCLNTSKAILPPPEPTFRERILAQARISNKPADEVRMYGS